MKGRRKTTLKKAFLNVTAVGLAVFTTGGTIANENVAAINTALGIKTYEIVNKDGGDNGEYVRYYQSKYDNIADLKRDGFAKAREAEAEGAVLLKNENGYLPLKNPEVSLFGVTSVDPVYGGTGSGAVSAADAPTYQSAFEASGLTVNQALVDWYESSEYGRVIGEGNNTDGRPISIGEAPWSAVSAACDGKFGNGETAVFIVGRCGGEGCDLRCSTQEDGLDGDYLTLNEEERSVLQGLKEMKDAGTISGIVVLINSANPISCRFLNEEEYGVDAALWIGSVGQTGLYAVGDILKGSVNPSGKLTDTFWADNKLNPAVTNFGAFQYAGSEAYDFGLAPHKFNNYVVYQEGVYLGYKYTETRYEDKVLGTPKTGDFAYQDVVAYPFGYGLSYTEFDYSDMEVKKDGSGKDTVYEVSVTVTNTGSCAGKEAVQVYVQKPYTEYDIANQIGKPAVELAGYGKTELLEPGQSEELTIQVPEYFFTSFDAYEAGTYILSEGTHYLTAAANAHDAVNNILAVKGKTVADGMTADGDPELVESLEYQFDAETYSTSMGTGAEVRSLFDFGDINRYEGRGENSVEYISRNDWEGTVKLWQDEDHDTLSDNRVILTMNDQIAKDVVLDEEDIPADPEGLEFPVMGTGEHAIQLIDMRTDANGDPLPYDDPLWDDFLDQLTYEDLSKICAIGLRMTVGVQSVGKPETLDHNGPSGMTQPYGNGQNGYAVINNDPDKDSTGTCYPCNGIIAATFNDRLAEEIGELIGEDCMWAGYAGLYGTGINIHRTPYSGRVFEYFSEDGILTGLTAAKVSAGIQSKGVYVYNKHFVINDQENKRAGLGTWTTEQALREIYLRAFELPIIYADAKCVMSSFNRIGANWSATSYELMTEWLRGEAGMTGFAVTDMFDTQYMSKPHEVLAGNDIPDGFPGRVDKTTKLSSISDDVLLAEFAPYGPNGTTPSATMAWAMRESAHRVMYTVVHSRGMDGISEGSQIVTLTPWWQTAINTGKWVFGVLTVLAAALMVQDMVKRRKESCKKTADDRN